MTHYWWMHWFWITLWMSINCCEDTLHSNSTNLPLLNQGDHSPTTESIGSPSTTDNSLFDIKNITTPKTLLIRSTNPSLEKIDLTSWSSNVTNKNTTMETKETVINQRNSTDLNLTDNQLLINSSFNAINNTNNLTYLGEEVNNQSLIQNSQRIDIEEEDTEVDLLEGNLSAAGITGITLACVVVVGMICGISYFLYHNRGSNRPQVLNDRCSNPDSSGYIDDASVRDNSEEMYSLDNDSFLNSLEAMTIQNYWTDTVKHTKL